MSQSLLQHPHQVVIHFMLGCLEVQNILPEQHILAMNYSFFFKKSPLCLSGPHWINFNPLELSLLSSTWQFGDSDENYIPCPPSTTPSLLFSKLTLPRLLNLSLYNTALHSYNPPWKLSSRQPLASLYLLHLVSAQVETQCSEVDQTLQGRTRPFVHLLPLQCPRIIFILINLVSFEGIR